MQDTNLIFGHTWEEIQTMQQGTYQGPCIDVGKSGDYGADPIGRDMFKMIPSGDIVDYAERCKRLNRD